MQELMKNKYYNYESIKKLALSIKNGYTTFPVEDFVRDVMDEHWDEYELKMRMRRITLNLGKYLPNDYRQALAILDKVVAGFSEEFYDNALIYFPDFVEVYGQDESSWDLSIAALERYTCSSTAEFAVRSFIIKDEKRMMAQMRVWSRSENKHVRRLASEGCRPALPWGQALVSFKKNPMPVLCVVEELKNDSSSYVRKSVANNLNDISKTHPDLVVKIAKDWYGKSVNTDWIVKRGCRTLLKLGNKEVLRLFGFVDSNSVNVEKFMLCAPTVFIGEPLTFSIDLSVSQTTKIRVEYAIDYVKMSGKRNRKIFQVSEITLKEKQLKSYTKIHSFEQLSTRKHHPGIHSITLIINGDERGTLNFDVLDKKKSFKKSG